LCYYNKQAIICIECQVESHSGKDVRKLEEVASSIRTNLTKKVDEVRKMGNVLNGHEKDVIQHAQG
jgi:hypothetical protein